MPTHLQYDLPSMALGEVVNIEIINCLRTVEGLQNQTDHAKDLMNGYIRTKKSLQMTQLELSDMGLKTDVLQESIAGLSDQIQDAAVQYINACTQNSKVIIDTIQSVKDKLSESERTDDIESPVIISEERIRSLPLSYESMKFDSQYFSFEENTQNDPLSSITKFISDATEGSIGKEAGKVALDSVSQISAQRQNHDLTGTLIITASCTHKNVSILDPFEIDADRAIQIWNRAYPDDTIEVANLSQYSSPSQANNNVITVISGAKYGSCFVGMAHFIKSDITASNLSESDMAQLKEQLDIGAWLQYSTGGIGVDKNILNSVRQFLSTQKVYAHVDMIVMGATPSIASNKIDIGIKQLQIPEQTVRESANLVANDTGNSHESTAKMSLEETRKVNLKKLTSNSIISSLESIDRRQNQIFDLTSLMIALENYIRCIQDGAAKCVGVPIGYYKRSIDRNQIITSWLNKYGMKGAPIHSATQNPATTDTKSSDIRH